MIICRATLLFEIIYFSHFERQLPKSQNATHILKCGLVWEKVDRESVYSFYLFVFNQAVIQVVVYLSAHMTLTLLQKLYD